MSRHQVDNFKGRIWSGLFSRHSQLAIRIVCLRWAHAHSFVTVRDAVLKFSSRADIINKQLMELLSEGLGLSTDFFSQHLNSRKLMALRWNFYPACPRPADVLGASSHTDGCSITLLLQDKVGGLQILKDGQWIGIKPIEGAIVVNIGDTLHVSFPLLKTPPPLPALL